MKLSQIITLAVVTGTPITFAATLPDPDVDAATAILRPTRTQRHGVWPTSATGITFGGGYHHGSSGFQTYVTGTGRPFPTGCVAEPPVPTTSIEEPQMTALGSESKRSHGRRWTPNRKETDGEAEFYLPPRPHYCREGGRHSWGGVRLCGPKRTHTRHGTGYPHGTGTGGCGGGIRPTSIPLGTGGPRFTIQTVEPVSITATTEAIVTIEPTATSDTTSEATATDSGAIETDLGATSTAQGASATTAPGETESVNEDEVTV